MAYLKKSDLKSLYAESKTEAHIWREAYPGFERLMDNGLMEGLDPNLPEVNDGSLAAALFKLPKRIVNRKLTGTVKTTDRDEKWLAELANMQWENEIVPNANTQAPFDRKWKDAVRKAAGYGSVPLITLQIERDGKTYTDFIVAQPQDVTLEPGKVSDYDSDVIFWDVYYTRLQLENMIEQAKNEQGETPTDDGYNKWDIKALQTILDSKLGDDERSSLDTPRQQNQDGATKPKGFKFCIAFQRGVNAPFYMYHATTNATVREWSNPDPTGDIPVHFLYCYQDFINPYGIGIVKLAGGTQNVLDYMRQADVLATQLGLRPPIQIEGNADEIDIDSFTYTQDALWFSGNAKVNRMEMSNAVYTQLPQRVEMYQSSLNKLIPTGDTSVSSGAGDPTQSKTPAGVKLQAANLSIDDDDFKDNLYVTYEAVAKSMINTHFANMEGEDLMRVSDDEREILIKGGLEFPENEQGEVSNEVELIWDNLRANFDFSVDPEQDKATEDADKLEGLTKVAELFASDPTLEQDLTSAGKKLNKGELYAEIIALTSDNDKIITDISPDEQAAQEEQAVDPNAMAQEPPKTIAESIRWTPADLSPSERAQVLAQGGIEADAEPTPNDMQMQHGQNMDMINAVPEPQAPEQQATEITPEQQADIDAVMQEHGVDEQTALTALAAEAEGFPPEDVIAYMQTLKQPEVAA